MMKRGWIVLALLALVALAAACTPAQQAAVEKAAPTVAAAAKAVAPTVVAEVKAAAPTVAAAIQQAAPTVAAAAAAPKATEAAKAAAPTGKFTLIDIAVGDENDNGWNKAHLEATAKAVKERGWAYLAYKNLNPGNPAKPVCENIVAELVNQAKKDNPGGKVLVRFNSDDFIPCAEAAAKQFPDIFVDHISGDHVLKGGAPTNLTNNMGSMEYAKALAGCMAANQTKNNVIAYLNGPDNAETRRFFNAFAWGAQYCGKQLNKDVKAINLILGFWFPIPGQTNDPQQLLGQARALKADVFASGIDTQDALQFAKSLADKGESAFSLPYDYLPACAVAPNSCAGIPYFHWDQEINYVMDMVEKGQWKSEFKVWDPVWANVLTDKGTVVGFMPGPAAGDAGKAMVRQMADDFASGKLKLMQGPINWADGSTWVAQGQAPSYKDIWYTEKLISGTQQYGK